MDNTIVLDLETARSTTDCLHCGQPETSETLCTDRQGHRAIGWDNKAALGLSIGCYWDYIDSRIHWFDAQTLQKIVEHFVERQPLMVSFNGIGFDFVLMRALLTEQSPPQEVMDLNANFARLAEKSYDILAEIWQVDPDRKFERGLNSLDVIAQANGLGAKLSHGALAPHDWQSGRYADVLNYCQDDVYKTKALFEIIDTGIPILRGDGKPITLPNPRNILPWSNNSR